MPKKSPQKAAEKWSQRLSAASQDIVEGVRAVTEAPGVTASRNKQKWVQGIQQAITDGTWEKNVAQVSLSEWQSQLINKGVPRVSQGAAAAKQDMAQFLSELFSYQDQLQSKIASMPDVTPEDRIARAVEWMRGMRQFKSKG